MSKPILPTKEAILLSKDSKIINIIKKEFNKMSRKKTSELIKLIVTAKQNDIETISIKNLELSENILKQNTKRIDFIDNQPVLKSETYEEIYEIINSINCKRLSSNVNEIEDEESESWKGKKVDGKFEVTKYVTYTKLEKNTEENGEDTDYLYRFDENTKTDYYRNDDELQVIELDIISNGQETSIPIEFEYECDKCNERGMKTVHKRKPSQVASSSGNKINCSLLYPAEPKSKICNSLLEPIKSRTKTKPVYIFNGVAKSMIDDKESISKFKVISYKQIPVGPLTAAVVKIPNAYGESMIFLVDYKIEEQKQTQIVFDKNKHNIFNYIDNIDNHIINIEGYKHFGYLPMKIGAVIQYAASIFPSIGRNYHIALTGGASTGKTAFSQYWGATLYGNKLLEIANVTDISIPSLRGSVENITLFNHKLQQRTDGYLNSKELIIINELSSDVTMKQSLKGHLFNPEYTFSKVGGDTVPRTRNAQFIITENINPEHIGKYKNTVKKFYKSDECILVDESITKKSWNEEWDLELDISDNYYDDKPHLRLAIYSVRKKFENESKNWIDGDEVASDDRFLFYFFVSQKINSKEMDECILQNAINNKKDNQTSRLIRELYTKSFYERIKKSQKYFDMTAENENEYYKKLLNVIKSYDPKATIRYVKMYMGVLKLLRVIDERNVFKEEDLDIIKYLIENTKSKIEISQTTKLKINGPKNVIIPKQSEDTFSYDDF